MLAVLVISLFGGACSPIAVSLDYDPRVDFRRYATFDWLDNRPRVPDAVKATLSRHPAFSDAVRTALDGELEARSLAEDQIAPNLLVMWHVGRNERIDVRRFGYAYAAQYGSWSGAIDKRYYREGALVVDLIDASTMWLVWRGVASGARDEKAGPEEMTERVREAARKLLASYPPAS